MASADDKMEHSLVAQPSSAVEASGVTMAGVKIKADTAKIENYNGDLSTVTVGTPSIVSVRTAQRHNTQDAITSSFQGCIPQGCEATNNETKTAVPLKDRPGHLDFLSETSDTIYFRGISPKVLANERVLELLALIVEPIEVDMTERGQSGSGTVWARYAHPELAKQTVAKLHELQFQGYFRGFGLMTSFELGSFDISADRMNAVGKAMPRRKTSISYNPVLRRICELNKSGINSLPSYKEWLSERTAYKEKRIIETQEAAEKSLPALEERVGKDRSESDVLAQEDVKTPEGRSGPSRGGENKRLSVTEAVQEGTASSRDASEQREPRRTREKEKESSNTAGNKTNSSAGTKKRKDFSPVTARMETAAIFDWGFHAIDGILGEPEDDESKGKSLAERELFNAENKIANASGAQNTVERLDFLEAVKRDQQRNKKGSPAPTSGKPSTSTDAKIPVQDRSAGDTNADAHGNTVEQPTMSKPHPGTAAPGATAASHLGETQRVVAEATPVDESTTAQTTTAEVSSVQPSSQESEITKHDIENQDKEPETRNKNQKQNNDCAPTPSNSGKNPSNNGKPKGPKPPKLGAKVPAKTIRNLVRNPNVIVHEVHDVQYQQKNMVINKNTCYPCPSGAYLARVLLKSRQFSNPHEDPLMNLVSDVDSLGGLKNYDKEISESMAVVDATERAVRLILGTSLKPVYRANVFVIGDGKHPVTSACLALFLPHAMINGWNFYSIDPILEPEHLEERIAPYRRQNELNDTEEEDGVIASGQAHQTHKLLAEAGQEQRNRDYYSFTAEEKLKKTEPERPESNSTNIQTTAAAEEPESSKNNAGFKFRRQVKFQALKTAADRFKYLYPKQFRQYKLKSQDFLIPDELKRAGVENWEHYEDIVDFCRPVVPDPDTKKTITIGPFGGLISAMMPKNGDDEDAILAAEQDETGCEPRQSEADDPALLQGKKSTAAAAEEQSIEEAVPDLDSATATPEQIQAAYPKFQNLSIIVACHSHAPLKEFWDRVPKPRICITLPCCENYSDLGIRPTFQYDDFEIFSPKRRIRLYHG